MKTIDCKRCWRIIPDNGEECESCVENVSKKHNINKSNNLKRYGITLLKYQLMFERQGGACAMCLRKSERSLCVDHDHATKRVRALLCNSCNILIGFSQEDIGLLKRAIKYLNEHKGPGVRF